MASTRTTFSLDEALAEQARALGVNVSAAARDGVAAAVRSALAQADCRAYVDMPESADTFWVGAEAWGAE
jgi:post-segregation antitoxin (ccd killing protein)